MILAVDTCFGACSAAVLCGDRVLAARLAPMDRGHAEALAPMVEATMSDAGIEFGKLERLAVTTGPGSFTGQRIGLGFMRALRLALRSPLTGVTSLAAMAEQARVTMGAENAAAVHDARRGEVYVECVGTSPIPASLLSFERARDALSAHGPELVLAGTGAQSMAEALGAISSTVMAPDAIWVARLALCQPPGDGIPRPLYLRVPDAKLPSARK